MNKLITASTWQSVDLKLRLSHSRYPAHRGETKSCELTESHWTFPSVPAVLSPVYFHYVTYAVIGTCQKSVVDKLMSISDIKYLTLELSAAWRV